jgi:hypothetical protein
MAHMTRILWAVFGASFVAVACLIVLDLQPSAAPPPRADRPAESGEVARGPAGAPSSVDGDQGEAGSDPRPDPRVDPAQSETKDSGEADSSPPRSPEVFLRYLIGLVGKNDLEELLRRIRPGAAHRMQDLLLGILDADSARRRQELADQLQQLEFDFEELPGGLVRFRVRAPEGEDDPGDLYLVPDGDSWQLAAESDLPGPAADSARARDRLRLLAICQHTFFQEDLDGNGPDFAASTRALAEGLDRVPFYSGVIEPEFAAATDAQLVYDHYVFGRIDAGEGDFAYFAAPAEYGEGARATLLIDDRGRIWSKDLEGSPPPREWPGPDPEKHGWSEEAGLWD